MSLSQPKTTKKKCLAISKQKINVFLIYIVFLFVGLNIKLFSGFYTYNIVIFFLLIFNFEKLRIKKEYLGLVVLFSVAIVFTLFLQLFSANTIGINSFYFLLNLFLFIEFLLFVQIIPYKKINYNFILLFVSPPLFFSILMFHNSSIELFFLSFYNVEKYPAFGRYGGVFGRDVVRTQFS